MENNKAKEAAAKTDTIKPDAFKAENTVSLFTSFIKLPFFFSRSLYKDLIFSFSSGEADLYFTSNSLKSLTKLETMLSRLESPGFATLALVIFFKSFSNLLLFLKNTY